MNIHYLKFANINEAITVMQTNEPVLLWFDNGIPHIRGSHEFAISLIGELTHATGVILQDEEGNEYEETVPVVGYHVNVNAVNRALPEYLVPFEVFPVTPSCTFGGV